MPLLFRPTASLKFIDGKLCQYFEEITKGVGEWRYVPEYVTEKSTIGFESNVDESDQAQLMHPFVKDEFTGEAFPLVKPEMIAAPDLTRLKEICQNYLDFIDSPEYHSDNDFRVWVQETAMETFFGKDVYKYINQRTK